MGPCKWERVLIDESAPAHPFGRRSGSAFGPRKSAKRPPISHILGGSKGWTSLKFLALALVGEEGLHSLARKKPGVQISSPPLSKSPRVEMWAPATVLVSAARRRDGLRRTRGRGARPGGGRRPPVPPSGTRMTSSTAFGRGNRSSACWKRSPRKLGLNRQ